MKSARLFANGRSQAVRLPQDCRFEGTEVLVSRFDGLVILAPKNSGWSPLLKSLEKFSPDFMGSREQAPVQARKSLR